MMDAMTAMRQAHIIAGVYFDELDEKLKGRYPKLPDEKRLAIVAQLCTSASIDYLAAMIGGGIENTPINEFLGNTVFSVGISNDGRSFNVSAEVD